MEKTIIGGAGALLVSALGLLQVRKVDQSACQATHKGLCDKLNAVHDDITYIRKRLDDHIDNRDGQRERAEDKKVIL